MRGGWRNEPAQHSFARFRSRCSRRTCTFVLEKTFDYIIVDTAPINPVTDAYIISPFADVTLFVIRHDYTPKVFLEKLSEEHKLDSLKKASIVYNGIKGKGYQKYGYGYGYGYGYTDEALSKSWRNIFGKRK